MNKKYTYHGYTGPGGGHCPICWWGTDYNEHKKSREDRHPCVFPMKVANIDLFGYQEDYSINSSQYGAGPCFAREAKFSKGFDLFGMKKHYSEYTDEDKSGSFVLDDWALEALRNGEHISCIPQLLSYDIILHNHINFYLNTEGTNVKQVFWSPFGKSEDAHPKIKYRLNYRTSEKYPDGTKNYDVTIGPHTDVFVHVKKEDYIFQCSRLDEQTNAIEVAKNCIKYGIKGYFAGPIFSNMDREIYPIKKYIDNINTFYLGVITYEKKMEMYRKARLGSFIFKRNPSFSMAAIECLSSGTPIMVPTEDLQERGPANAMEETGIYDKQTLKEIGDVFYNGENFLECWKKAKTIEPYECYLKTTRRGYSDYSMLESFTAALREIYDQTD